MTRKKGQSKSKKAGSQKDDGILPMGSGNKAGFAPAQSAVNVALNRFRNLLSPEEYDRLVEELDLPLPPALRINPLKSQPAESVKAWRERYNWTLKSIAYEPAGWQVLSSPAPISQTIEHRLGFYYIQDAASMAPVALFDFDPSIDRPLILDMAASPGGKTTHLASRTGDHGLIIANDASVSRLPALRIVLQNWGAINTAITNYPGERFGTWYPEVFDRVLLDAPCSMQGLRSTESHPIRPISDNEIQGLSQRQGRLLESAFKAVRPGGQVVYSTCTLTPDEDEAVVDGLLKHYPDLARVEDISAHFPAPVPGLISDGSHSFDPSLERSARLWPHRLGTSGFFAALISKKDSLMGHLGSEPHDRRPGNAFGLGGLTRLSPRQQSNLLDRFTQCYGFDFTNQVENQGLILAQRSSGANTRQIYSLPEIFAERFMDLRAHTLGLLFCEETPGGFVLSHEWAARFGHRFTAGHFLLPEELVSHWIKGEDLPGIAAAAPPANPIVMVTDLSGRNLGRGKIQRERLKNLLPKRIL